MITSGRSAGSVRLFACEGYHPMRERRSHTGAHFKGTSGVLAVAALAAMITTTEAQDVALPKLDTLEAYVDEVTRATALDVKDPMAVLAFVLNSLPGRVKVYPTENYYYFNFYYGGAPYAG